MNSYNFQNDKPVGAPRSLSSYEPGTTREAVALPAESTDRQPSTLVSRNVIVAGKRTSIRLEPAYWDALRVITKRENVSLNELCTRIHRLNLCSSFTAAVRVIALKYFWQPEVRRAIFPDRLYQAADYGRSQSPAVGDNRDYGSNNRHGTLSDAYSNRPHATRRYD